MSETTVLSDISAAAVVCQLEGVNAQSCDDAHYPKALIVGM